jgi:hypothetical protein
VNMGETKVMRCRVGAGEVVKSEKFSCSVCSKGLGANSVKCTSRSSWIQKRCSDICGMLTSVSTIVRRM